MMSSPAFEEEASAPQATSRPPITLYDTTLRDGAQQDGLSLSVQDKLAIAQHLDQLGIPFIEGGWPGANPKDVQFFWQLKEEPLQQAEVVAFCSTRRPYRTAADDPLFQPILAAGTRYVTLFGKSWDLHVTEGLGTTLGENLAMIRDSISYLRSRHRNVIYDAEHWFDAYNKNPDYALKTLQAAAGAGAAWLVLCDTNGGTLPHDIDRIVRAVIAEQHHWGAIPIGIHTHNDSEMAVANAIAAVRAGASMVQGTINGYGERCGNANLCSVIPNLQLKLGYSCLQPEQLEQLTDTARATSEIANQAPNDRSPFVGRSAFAHKGGIHVSAVRKNPLTYEHIRPALVGNNRRIVISEQAGLSNILAKAERYGLVLSKGDPTTRQILTELKHLEHAGYQFEGAEASFELLVRSCVNQRDHPFQLAYFNIHSSTETTQVHPPQSTGFRDGDPAANHPDKTQTIQTSTDPIAQETNMNSIATVKVVVEGQSRMQAAEGHGPVQALDTALRQALLEFFPDIHQFQLADYKVRILDSSAGTAARTRVSITFSHTGNGLPLTGEYRWTTVGVSGNVLEASYKALAEGLEYGLLKTLNLEAQRSCQLPLTP